MDNAAFTFLVARQKSKFISKETELNLNYRSLLEPTLKLDSLSIKQGRFIWPASETNQLTLNQITTLVRFDGKSKLEVEKFEAEFLGARIHAEGVVTNPVALRDWKIFKRKKPDRPPRDINRLVETLEKIRLAGNPKLEIRFSGDAKDPNSIQGDVDFSTLRARSPWASGTGVQVSAQIREILSPRGNNFVRLRSDFVTTQWGGASNIHALVKFVPGTAGKETYQTKIRFSANALESEFGGAQAVHFNGESDQFLTNPIPANVSGNLVLTNAETKWGSATFADVTFTASTNPAPKIATEDWAEWCKAEPYQLAWSLKAVGVKTPKIQVDEVFCEGSWLAPEIKISALNGRLYQGGLQMTGQLDVATRKASAKSSFDFDVQKISPFLTPFGQRWIAKYTWEKPPKVNGELSVVLPAWTNKAPKWRQEVLPTLVLNGDVSVGRGTYRDVVADSAQTSFHYSNMVWNLPHIRVNRPEGGAELRVRYPVAP